MGENQNGSGGQAQEFMLSYMKVRRSVSESPRSEQEDPAPKQEESRQDVQDPSDAAISGGEEGRSMNIDDEIDLSADSSKKTDPAEMSSDARAKAALASAFAMIDHRKNAKEEQAAREAAEAEAARKAAEEEEARKAAEAAAEEERRLAEIKAEEERRLAEERAEEERRLAEQREREEEERRLEEERAEIARRFAEEQAEEEARRKAEEEARLQAEAEAKAAEEAEAAAQAEAEAAAQAETEAAAQAEAEGAQAEGETVPAAEEDPAVEAEASTETGAESSETSDTTEVTEAENPEAEASVSEDEDQTEQKVSLEKSEEGAEENEEFFDDEPTEELSVREEEDQTEELSYAVNSEGETTFRSKKKRLSDAAEVEGTFTEGIHFLDNGNIIFGRYDQGNGPESIEWIVLKQERGGKLFVISKYALDYLPYHELSRGVSWESCSLREWLNKTFIRTAFTEKEQSHLIEYHVPADRNPECDTTVGPSTRDRVFLLSLKEAKKYFDNDAKRVCNATPFARSHQQNPDPIRTVSWWWLRTAGNFIYNAAGIAPDGSLYYRGRPVDDGDSAVRPAMWIKLKE